MKLILGYNAYKWKSGVKQPVVWDSATIQNPHMLILGQSGSGKSHSIKSIINQISQQNKGVRFHVIDVHGDLQINNESVQLFSSATNTGFNPFVLNPNPHSGGIRVCIQSFIDLLSIGRELGSKQQAVLRQILLDVFAARGFYYSDNSTWFSGVNTDKEKEAFAKLNENRKATYKEYPTLDDVIRYAKYKQRAMELGTSNKTISLLDEVNKLSKNIYNQTKKGLKNHDAEEKSKLDLSVANLKEKCINSFTEYLDGIETGRELEEWKKYDNADTLNSIIERLENLSASGIFKNNEPNFDTNKPVWRYDIHYLSSDNEKRMFVNFLLNRIYRNRVDNGERKEVVEFIVLDEGAMFFNKERGHIINIIATQARKFGLGLICATQNVNHASEDFISSVATKCIFALSEITWATSMKKLNIPQDYLKSLKPRTNVLVKMQVVNEVSKQYEICVAP